MPCGLLTADSRHQHAQIGNPEYPVPGTCSGFSRTDCQVQGIGEVEASFTLFYGKFRLHAPRIKALMAEMERRAPGSTAYSALIRDCCDCYYAQRMALLAPTVAADVRRLLKEHAADLPGLLRAGCAAMVTKPWPLSYFCPSCSPPVLPE